MCNNQYNMPQCEGFGFPLSWYQKLPNQQKNIIHVTNNRAKYYSELALKYKNEAKELRDSAKYYSEQNSDVTLAYVNSTAVSLQRAIDSKQDLGDYALSSDIPQNVSELTNDSQYINDTELQSAVGDCESYTDTAVTTLSNTTTSNLLAKADSTLDNITTTAQVMLSGMSMPSSTYVGLTLGATNTFYIAPTNGWFAVGKAASGNNQSMAIVNETAKIIISGGPANAAGQELYVYMPCSQGDKCYVNYNLGGVTIFFRFVYAQGSESEAS